MELVLKIKAMMESQLITIGDHTVNGFSVLASVFVVIATFWISKLIQGGLHKGMLKRGNADLGTVMGTKRLVHYFIIVIGCSFALHTLGINLNGLFAAGAVFAVGIGFALQNVVQNFVSGIILLFERSITPKDILEINGSVVEVQRMGIRSTTVRTRDGENVIVPNSILVQDAVKNLTLDNNAYRVKASVGVAYEADQHQVLEILGEVALKLHDAPKSSEPTVLLTGFGVSSVDYEVAIWITRPWLSRRVLSKLNIEIWDQLKAAGISIPFPQLDVHTMASPPVDHSAML